MAEVLTEKTKKAAKNVGKKLSDKTAIDNEFREIEVSESDSRLATTKDAQELMDDPSKAGKKGLGPNDKIKSKKSLDKMRDAGGIDDMTIGELKRIVRMTEEDKKDIESGAKIESMSDLKKLSQERIKEIQDNKK